STELQTKREHLVGAVVHDLVRAEASQQALHRVEVVVGEFVAADVGDGEQRSQLVERALLAGETRNVVGDDRQFAGAGQVAVKAVDFGPGIPAGKGRNAANGVGADFCGVIG